MSRAARVKQLQRYVEEVIRLSKFAPTRDDAEGEQSIVVDDRGGVLIITVRHDSDGRVEVWRRRGNGGWALVETRRPQ
jgi:hypothetical protein